MKLTLEIHLVMRIKDKSNCREANAEVNARNDIWSCVLKIRAIVEIKLALERSCVLKICREMKLTLEIHLVMRIKDKSNCRDGVNARNTSGHAY